ncbi:hypothetical protein C0J52_21716 [Blattella germanica]|nr:hypothetical protein C0J52_21716 [Blattella germanica]
MMFSSFLFLLHFLKRFLQVFTDRANSAASWTKPPFPPPFAPPLASVAPRNRHAGSQTGTGITPSGPQSQQFGGAMGYQTEPDSWSEPLNLVKKKKPVAVVAPSSVVEKNNTENENCKTESIDSSVKDLNTAKECYEYDDTSNPHSKLDFNEESPKPSGMLEALLTNKDSKYIQNTGEVDKTENENDLMKKEKEIVSSSDDPGGGTPATPGGFDPLRPDGLYSMIHSLAACEQKFLTALYMNSLMSATVATPPSVISPPVMGFGFPRGHGYFLGYENTALTDAGHNNLVTGNSTMNNLLSFADTQHRLWQMVNNQQDLIQQRLNNANIGHHRWTRKIPPPRQRRARKLRTQDKRVITKWHSLTREEQAKYYEKARQERQLHMQLYPGWSARDNYGYGAKKKKRKKERSADPGGTLSSSARTAWHALGREEQAKYYELARRERQLHMQLYPDWSSRANSSRGKKRKRKQETNDGGNSMKKCRARYGLDQQSQWCKPCRRKKKCIRYMESNESMDGNQSEDNLGSCGSVGDANTPPEDDRESINHSLSSPGGLSGLSSLTSPSMILPSPSTSLASPSVSLASPCMSLQSPLTPHDASAFECKTPMNGLGGGNILPPHQPPSTSSNTSSSGGGGGGGLPSVHHHHPPHHPPPAGPPLHRNPVGTNPHDINNPLSVNQLTGQCIKTESGGSGKDSSSNSARAVISVT